MDRCPAGKEVPVSYGEHDRKLREKGHDYTGVQTSSTAWWEARVLVKQRVKGRWDGRARLVRSQ